MSSLILKLQHKKKKETAFETASCCSIVTFFCQITPEKLLQLGAPLGVALPIGFPIAENCNLTVKVTRTGVSRFFPVVFLQTDKVVLFSSPCHG
jgi:hypothetical protein